MAIYEFYELDTSDRGGTFNDDFQREYTTHYFARSNSENDLEPEIWAHPKCPIPRITVANWDTLARCREVAATRRKNTRWDWDVVAKWSSVQVSQAKQENPLNDPVSIETETVLVDEERYFDRDGNAILNTAGDLVKVVLAVPRLSFEITKNVALTNSWITQLSGVTNSAEIRIDGILCLPDTLKIMRAHTGAIQYRNEIAFKVARLSIQHKEEGWYTPILNVGYNEYVEDLFQFDKKGNPLKVKRRCRTGEYSENGMPLGDVEASPVFLDADGFRYREAYTDAQGVYKDITETRPLLGTYHSGRPKTVLDPQDFLLLKPNLLKRYDFNRLAPVLT